MRIKIITLSIISALAISCSTHKGIINTEHQKNTNTVMIGKVEGESLKDNPLFPNTKYNYTNYSVNEKLIKTILNKEEGINIKVVFGPWCGDSKRNVPIFQKIIDTSGFDKSKIEYIAVDRNKQGGSYDVSGLDIKRVPTFIFYKNNKEIGRIIESPKFGSIEQDWVNIVDK